MSPRTSCPGRGPSKAGASVPDLSTLVAEVRAVGLVGTLAGARLFTVFAPPGEAFGKLPAGTLDKLLIPRCKTEP